MRSIWVGVVRSCCAPHSIHLLLDPRLDVCASLDREVRRGVLHLLYAFPFSTDAATKVEANINQHPLPVSLSMKTSSLMATSALSRSMSVPVQL